MTDFDRAIQYAEKSGKLLGTLTIIQIMTEKSYGAEIDKKTLQEINQKIKELMIELGEDKKGAA